MPSHQSSGRSDRSNWPVNVYPIDDEPSEDLSASTSAEERLQMVTELTLEAWALGSFEIPKYSRDKTPIRLMNLRT